MAEHRHDLRELGAGESGDPTEAWIEFATGGRLDLTLTRTGERTWTARPEQPVAVIRPGDHLRVDRLGPGVQVTFENVVMPGAPDPADG